MSTTRLTLLGVPGVVTTFAPKGETMSAYSGGRYTRLTLLGTMGRPTTYAVKGITLTSALTRHRLPWTGVSAERTILNKLAANQKGIATPTRLSWLGVGMTRFRQATKTTAILTTKDAGPFGFLGVTMTVKSQVQQGNKPPTLKRFRLRKTLSELGTKTGTRQEHHKEP